MYCPFCTKEDTKVLESRIHLNSVRRRRECLKCKNRFTTYEKVELYHTVIKKDGHEEPFSLEKIRHSITKACGKVEEHFIDELARKVETKLHHKKVHPLKTSYIAKCVMKELKSFDKLAYLRFASVHKSIADPRLLEREINLIIER